MTWTNLSYAFESILTSAKVTQQYENVIAMPAGDSGAPKIQSNNCLIDNTIGGNKLKRVVAGTYVNTLAAYSAFYPTAMVGYGMRSSGWSSSWWELCVNSYWTSGSSWGGAGVTIDCGLMITDGNYWRFYNSTGSVRYCTVSHI